MLSHKNLISFFIFVLITLLCSSACEKKVEGKLIITGQDFSVRQDGKNSWSLDVKGKIKNAGAVDLKRIFVTGYCRSCGEIVSQGQWFVNDLEKTPIQKAVIGYLSAGNEEEFSFKEVAYYYAKAGEEPKVFPEKIEIVIESFETVN